jgi:hypothetical protein
MEETIMAAKKSMMVLFGVLVISSFVLASVIQAGAETMKCKNIATATKDERISVSDEERHTLGLQLMEGLAYCENGEIAKIKHHALIDAMPPKGGQAIGYTIYTFDDGSTIVIRFQRLMVPDQSGGISAKASSEIIKGTGRFQGIKGTASATGKNFLATKDEAARVFNDSTLTYTLPAK